jgi:hypothetical protein
MTEVPKTVHDRLRSAALAQTPPNQALPERHPDADLLTAFAEQSLSAAERDGVLEHLAVCGDCREVIALALPAADFAPVPNVASTEDQATLNQANTKKSWRTDSKLAWPTLRWAALAAGVVVVASVLLTRPGRLSPPATPSVAEVATTARPLPGAASDSQSPASHPSPMFNERASAKKSKTGDATPKQPLQPSANQLVSNSVVSAPGTQFEASSSLPSSSSSLRSFSAGQAQAVVNPDAMRLSREDPASKRGKSVEPLTPSLRVKSEIVIADAKKDSNAPDRDLPEVARVFEDTSAGQGANVSVEASAVPAATETATVTHGSPLSRNDAPVIEKAKQPLQVAANQKTATGTAAAGGSFGLSGKNAMSAARVASTSQTSRISVAFMISSGVLQRSLDSGQNWQNALRADHALLCYAPHGDDVWTGGQAGTLFHSTDSGATWIRVQPSSKSQTLTSDIASIDFFGDDAHGTTQIVLTTNNHEIWSSVDGGKTWDKK